MRLQSNRRIILPYRILSVVIMGALLALLLAAFSNPTSLTPRSILLLLAGVLFLLVIMLEVVFRDVTRMRERVRSLEKNREL